MLVVLVKSWCTGVANKRGFLLVALRTTLIKGWTWLTALILENSSVSAFETCAYRTNIALGVNIVASIALMSGGIEQICVRHASSTIIFRCAVSAPFDQLATRLAFTLNWVKLIVTNSAIIAWFNTSITVIVCCPARLAFPGTQKIFLWSAFEALSLKIASFAMCDIAALGAFLELSVKIVVFQTFTTGVF